MYLLDPDRGARRRALVRDKLVRASHKTADGLDALSRDVGNRARGAAAEVQGRMRGEDVDRRRLTERVRAELGRVVSHPRSIDVSASDDGSVCLIGPILSNEADAALSAISSVRGVRSVEDRLERHETADVAALQGGRERPGRRSALLQESWSPTTTLLVFVTGGALAAGVGYAAQHARKETYH
jgi:hypothetical protein